MKLDKGFWNVVSIREPQVPRPDFLRYAKRYHEVIGEDREEVDPDVPSRLLRLCLEQFLSAKRANELTVQLANHPVLVENRFVKPRETYQTRSPQ